MIPEIKAKKWEAAKKVEKHGWNLPDTTFES
jgi:hypothetical protein